MGGDEDVPLLLPSKRQDLDVFDDDYHEASVPSAVFNLSTTIVGAGIMALPATMKVLGLPLGILTIVVMGVLSENSIQIMLRYSRPSGARSYGGLMADAFGRFGRALVQICIVVNNVGILIVYMIIIGMCSREALQVQGSTTPACSKSGRAVQRGGTTAPSSSSQSPSSSSSRSSHSAMSVCYSSHSNFQRTSKLPRFIDRMRPLTDSLKWTSALSVALAVVFVVIIAGVTIWKLFAGDISWPRLTPDVHDLASFWKLFTVIPVMVTAYICHHNVHPIANELADDKMQDVVRWSMFLCGTIYLFTATFGYLLFGENTSDDILSNFDTDLGVPFSGALCVVVRVSYAVHLMLVFPLLNFSLRLNLDAILFPRATPLAHDTVRFGAITGFLLLCIFFGAGVVPNIWIAFQFTGATATVCLGFIFPALVLLKDKFLLATRRDKCEAVVMVILAILSSVVAVTTDVFNLLEPGKQAGLSSYLF